MKKALLAVGVFVALIVIFNVALQIFHHSEKQRWLAWVARVRIAEQHGNNVNDVILLLGAPGSVLTGKRIKGIITGITPTIRKPDGAVKAYLYTRHFFSDGGVWNCYVFFDKNGRVICASMGHS